MVILTGIFYAFCCYVGVWLAVLHTERCKKLWTRRDIEWRKHECELCKATAAMAKPLAKNAIVFRGQFNSLN
jgi:hypothetical protein